MSVKLEMPKLSDTMTEGTLVAWRVAVGDEIEIGDVIADIETDKATMEMEAFDEGVLTEILVEAGSKVPVGSVLGTLSEEGDDTSSDSDASQESGSEDTAAKSDDEGDSVPSQPAQTAASQDGGTEQSISGNSTKEDGSRLRVSPLARKIADEKGVDLNSLEGSGPGGRIVAADVENAKDSKSQSKESQPSSSITASDSNKQDSPPKGQPAKPAPAPAQSAAINPVVADEDKVTPLSGMRKIIAERLLTSKQTIPHFYLHVEVDAGPLIELRKQVNSQVDQSHGNKFTFNDFVVKAMINACLKVPEVNASFNGDSIVQFANVGVSIAIAVEDGLVTPVVKNAQTKSMLQISKEIKEMAVRAKEKKLMPNEFDNGTITISNLGAWGIESFDAIVNPPQAAIISVGGIIEKPVVKNGEIVPGMRMNLGMSCDHRVVDGAVAATYLNELKKLLEQPSLMLI